MTRKKPATKRRSTAPARRPAAKVPARRAKPVLLSGGNPQIAKASGAAPVRAWIAAVPADRRAIARRIDALITQVVPGIRKAVKWNSPFYGMAGRGWIVAMHVFTRYIKVTFFEGSKLQPLPPGPSKDPNARYLDVRIGDAIDEAQFQRWVQQASRLQGWLRVE